MSDAATDTAQAVFRCAWRVLEAKKAHEKLSNFSHTILDAIPPEHRNSGKKLPEAVQEEILRTLQASVSHYADLSAAWFKSIQELFSAFGSDAVADMRECDNFSDCAKLNCDLSGMLSTAMKNRLAAGIIEAHEKLLGEVRAEQASLLKRVGVNAAEAASRTQNPYDEYFTMFDTYPMDFLPRSVARRPGGTPETNENRRGQMLNNAAAQIARLPLLRWSEEQLAHFSAAGQETLKNIYDDVKEAIVAKVDEEIRPLVTEVFERRTTRRSGGRQ